MEISQVFFHAEIEMASRILFEADFAPDGDSYPAQLLFQFLFIALEQTLHIMMYNEGFA